MRIVGLLENTDSKTVEGLSTEHGLSIFVQKDNTNILVDTGASDAFLRNADMLGIDMRSVDMLILSHAHTDHVGGLGYFLGVNKKASVYLNKNAIDEYYIRKTPDVYRYIGLDADLLSDHRHRFNLVSDFTTISDNIHLLSHFDREHHFPKNDNLMKKSEGEFITDPFDHELLLVIVDNGKLVLFTGCAHSGILNMIAAATDRFPDTPIKGIFGGFHLQDPISKRLSEAPDTVVNIARSLLDRSIESIYSGHCTGDEAYSILEKQLGEKLHHLATGTALEI